MNSTYSASLNASQYHNEMLAKAASYRQAKKATARKSALLNLLLNLFS